MAFSSSKKTPLYYLPGGLLLLLGMLQAFSSYQLLKDALEIQPIVPKLEAINQLAADLFEATHGFSRTSEFAVVALSNEHAMAQSVQNAVLENRKKTDAVLTKVLKEATALYPEDSEAISAKLNVVLSLQKKVDRDTVLEMSQRDSSLPEKWAQESADLQNNLDALLSHLLQTATHADSIFAEHVTLNLQIQHLRISAGAEGASLLAAVVAAKPLTNKTLQQIYAARAKTSYLWTDTQRDIRALEDPALAKAITPVQQAYFDNFQPRQDILLNAGINEKPYPIPWLEHQTQMIAALDSFTELSHAVNKATARRLDARRAMLTEQFVQGGAPLGVTCLLILWTFWLIRKRVGGGGIQAGAVLNALQTGNVQSLNSSGMSPAETANLAQYVKSFQEQAFETKRSEALSRIQRNLSVELSGCSNLSNALQLVLGAVCSISDIDCAGIYLEDPETLGFNLAASHGLPEKFVAATAHFDVDSPLVRSLVQQEPLYLQYSPTNPILKNIPPDAGIRAIAILPVEHDGHVIASINIASHSVDDTPVSARVTLEAIAALIGGTLARLRAEVTLANLNHTLEQRVTRETDLRVEKERMLVQQSRMAAMGEMIGVIAHQWRQPLNSVAVNIQNIKDAYEYNELNPEQMKQAVENAMQQLGFMSKTIDDFRNFFRPDKKKAIFDAKQAAGDVFAMLSPQLHNNSINYRVICGAHQQQVENFTAYQSDCHDMEVYGYENELKQVFLNLVSNSKDAIQERIARALMRSGETGDISISFAQEDSHVIILLRDNGGGIPAAVMERIFEPYFTTKEPGRGTGIGLYMAKIIVEKNMGGKLTVQNIDSGTEFRIEL